MQRLRRRDVLWLEGDEVILLRDFEGGGFICVPANIESLRLHCSR